jgi:AGZA family xanthine/uracil permease-like MFS transporter
MTWVHNVNLKVARSPVGKYFRLDGSGHVRSTRLRANTALELY